MKLFISSLIGGYEAERAAVAHAAQVLRWEVLRAEDFGARPDTPQQACLEAVRRADLVVLVLGARYGAVQESGLSATHEEWREATRGQKPTLVFVETVDDCEVEQRKFIYEVQGWAAGRFRDSFGTPQELQDKVTRALADFGGAGLADEGEVTSRALAALPEQSHRSFGGGAKLVIAVASGPRQPVLRPAEIEDAGLVADLHRDAMFGADAPLDAHAATQPRLDGNRLRIVQDHAEVVVQEDGTVTVSRAAMNADGYRSGSTPSIIEEDLRDRIAGTLRFVFSVLERIDPAHRLTDVVPVTALVDSRHTPWRTLAEATANPGSATMPFGHGDEQPVTTCPAMIRRSALVHESQRIAEDLTVLLRRQHR